jgi:hypothetical protein
MNAILHGPEPTLELESGKEASPELIDFIHQCLVRVRVRIRIRVRVGVRVGVRANLEADQLYADPNPNLNLKDSAKCDKNFAKKLLNHSFLSSARERGVLTANSSG